MFRTSNKHARVAQNEAQISKDAAGDAIHALRDNFAPAVKDAVVHAAEAAKHYAPVVAENAKGTLAAQRDAAAPKLAAAGSTAAARAEAARKLAAERAEAARGTAKDEVGPKIQSLLEAATAAATTAAAAARENAKETSSNVVDNVKSNTPKAKKKKAKKKSAMKKLVGLAALGAIGGVAFSQLNKKKPANDPWAAPLTDPATGTGAANTFGGGTVSTSNSLGGDAYTDEGSLGGVPTTADTMETSAPAGQGGVSVGNESTTTVNATTAGDDVPLVESDVQTSDPIGVADDEGMNDLAMTDADEDKKH